MVKGTSSYVITVPQIDRNWQMSTIHQNISSKNFPNCVKQAKKWKFLFQSDQTKILSDFFQCEQQNMIGFFYVYPMT